MIRRLARPAAALMAAAAAVVFRRVAVRGRRDSARPHALGHGRRRLPVGARPSGPRRAPRGLRAADRPPGPRLDRPHDRGRADRGLRGPGLRGLEGRPRGHDDGLVLFIFADDRKARFEVGYGLEGSFPDISASRVIREVLAPRLQAGDRDGAVSAAIEAATAMISGDAAASGLSGPGPGNAGRGRGNPGP